ncbi:hypothetical protein HYQ44_013482 [Verticillium longisporum]|nr:hypothetical protein HYQ44_013482 [Verticillium longisporum]
MISKTALAALAGYLLAASASPVNSPGAEKRQSPLPDLLVVPGLAKVGELLGGPKASPRDLPVPGLKGLPIPDLPVVGGAGLPLGGGGLPLAGPSPLGGGASPLGGVNPVGGANPLGSVLPKRQISLPPLIPAIPGVTEPLADNAIPLPVLQLPTPPLDSPPFTGSNIKPKKIGYFWTGAGDNKHKDFLITMSLDDDTFGEIITLTDVPSSGNSPHHLGPSADGKTLIGGGLLSLLKTQDTAFYFDVSDPYNPKCPGHIIDILFN